MISDYFQKSAGRVSLTTDVWSNKQLASFLAVTAHWLSTESHQLTLKAALIGFHRMTGRHNGTSIAAGILEVVQRAGITNKVCLDTNVNCFFQINYYLDWPHHDGQCHE